MCELTMGYAFCYSGLFPCQCQAIFIITALSSTLKDKSMVPQCEYEKNVQSPIY